MNQPISDEVKVYLRGIGAKGGRMSRRQLDPVQARRMVAVREARKAFRRYKTQCFWSFDPEWTIQHDQVPIVIQALRSEGDAKTFTLAKKLRKLYSEKEL